MDCDLFSKHRKNKINSYYHLLVANSTNLNSSGQREAVSDFLVALTSKLQPSMLLKLLRKLTVDVSKLSEYTTVALRLLTLHYDRCAKYYGSTSSGSSSDEEKRLTMMLFSNIFDSLSKMVSYILWPLQRWLGGQGADQSYRLCGF